MRFFQRVLAFLYVLLFPALCFSAQELIYTQKTTQQNSASSTKKIPAPSPQEDGTYKVTLFPTQFSIAHEQKEYWYNFTTKMRTEIDHTQRSFMRVPLHQVVSFRAMEKQNRENISAMMNAVLADQPQKSTGMDNSPFNLETIFSLPGKTPLTPPVDCSVQGQGNAMVCTHAGHMAVSLEWRAEQVSSELLPIYEKYLLYTHLLHPDIRKKIIAQGKFQNLLHAVSTPSFSQETMTDTFTSVRTVATSEMAIPSGYTEKKSADAELNAVLLAAQDKSKRRSRESYRQEIKSLLAQHKEVDAYLALLEYVFESGEILAEFKSSFARAPKDSPIVAITAASSAKSKEEIQRALQILQSIPREKLKHGYVLDVLSSNHSAKLGDSVGAKKYMKSALQKNPFMVGAYADLGKIYYVEFDMINAWICWNQALEILSTHPQLAFLHALKSKFEKEYPEYF